MESPGGVGIPRYGWGLDRHDRTDGGFCRKRGYLFICPQRLHREKRPRTGHHDAAGLGPRFAGWIKEKTQKIISPFNTKYFDTARQASIHAGLAIFLKHFPAQRQLLDIACFSFYTSLLKTQGPVQNQSPN